MNPLLLGTAHLIKYTCFCILRQLLLFESARGPAEQVSRWPSSGRHRRKLSVYGTKQLFFIHALAVLTQGDRCAIMKIMNDGETRNRGGKGRPARSPG